MAKQIVYGEEARKALLAGVDKLADTVTAFSRGVETVTTNCAKKQLDAWRRGESSSAQ